MYETDYPGDERAEEPNRRLLRHSKDWQQLKLAPPLRQRDRGQSSVNRDGC